MTKTERFHRFMDSCLHDDIDSLHGWPLKETATNFGIGILMLLMAALHLSTEPRPILRLHHPKPTQPKPPRLGRNEFYAGGGKASRRYFKGAKRQRLH